LNYRYLFTIYTVFFILYLNSDKNKNKGKTKEEEHPFFIYSKWLSEKPEDRPRAKPLGRGE
jgi:hypothetical protein